MPQTALRRIAVESTRFKNGESATASNTEKIKKSLTPKVAAGATGKLGENPVTSHKSLKLNIKFCHADDTEMSMSQITSYHLVGITKSPVDRPGFPNDVQKR
jgi:hypothetical protein